MNMEHMYIVLYGKIRENTLCVTRNEVNVPHVMMVENTMYKTH